MPLHSSPYKADFCRLQGSRSLCTAANSARSRSVLHQCVMQQLLVAAAVINSGNQKNLGSLGVMEKKIHIFFMDPKVKEPLAY